MEFDFTAGKVEKRKLELKNMNIKRTGPIGPNYEKQITNFPKIRCR